MPEFEYTPEEFENLVNNVYLGNVSPDSLPLDLYNAINGYLSAGLDLVFGENIVFDVGAPDLKLYQYFKHNVAVFSGAKTYQQARDMSELVFSPDGFKRSFNDFKKDAGKVFDTYNKNWLRTEYDTAVTSAQTATQWNQITEDAEALPYLKYVTAGDERVRQDHRAWNGITLPVNHKFWDTHYPPNGWNCRCMVVQLDDNDRVRITPEETLDIVPPPDSELFNNNPAKTGVIFDKSHPYFNFKKEHQARASRNFGLPTPEKPAEEIAERVFKPSKTTKETEQRLKALGLERVELRGLKIDQQNTVLKAFEDEAKIKPITVKEFKTYRKNNKDGALYSPSNMSLNLNLSNIEKLEGAQKVISYSDQIKNIKQDYKLYKTMYGNHPNQRHVNRELNKMETRINKLEVKIKSGEVAKPFTVSSSMETVEDKLRAKIIHELGHHRHYEEIGADAYIGYNKKLSPTDYGGSNKYEYFAEWFAHYRIKGAEGVPETILKQFKRLENGK